MNITITPAANNFIRRMIRFGGVQDGGFRLSVSPGGCSGLAADFSIEAAPKTGDAILEKDGLKLFFPVESRLLLEGVTIDCADTPTESGLVFRDPKAPGSACGTSSRAPEFVSLSNSFRR